jgi:ribonuclease P protein component
VLSLNVTKLTKRPDYLAVAQTRRKWVTPSFIIQAKPDCQDDQTVTIGFTASKKVGNAVKRNKARRRLKEVARSTIIKHGQASWSYVFIARQSAISYPYEKIILDMIWALAKLHSGADLKTKQNKRS